MTNDERDKLLREIGEGVVELRTAAKGDRERIRRIEERQEDCQKNTHGRLVELETDAKRSRATKAGTITAVVGAIISSIAAALGMGVAK